MKEFIFGKIRLQLLSDEIVRLEMAQNGKFEDRNTFFIPNRNFNSDDIDYSLTERKDDCLIQLSGYSIVIPKKCRGLSSIVFYYGRKKVYQYASLKNTGELPSYDKTPFIYPIIDSPRIVVPEHGYHYESKASDLNDFEIDSTARDIYLLLCGKDFKKLRKLYLDITGRPNLVRLSTLGSWNSKYYAYTQEEAMQIIRDYQEHDVPLDNVVIDTDWREMASGIGYDINTKLFPDMAAYFEFAHKNNIEIMFNDHPEPQKDCKNLLSPNEVKFREEKLQDLMRMGLDYWWYDRNWRTKLISPDDYINPETWGMYVFNDIEKHYYQKATKGSPRRTGLMSNVDNIHNGRYIGIQNSASHRYSIQWTGDINSTVYTLFEAIQDIVKGGMNCIPYTHPDCGGHTGNPDKELYIRWMQMGCFFPVLRPHCTNTVIRTREPWKFDDETTNIVRDYIKMRYRLLPTIYANAYQSYADGTPICRSILSEYPDEKESSLYFGEYLFTKNILVGYTNYDHCPIVDIVDKDEMDKKYYSSKVKATFYNGTNLQGEPLLVKEYDTLSFRLFETPIEKEVPIYHFSARYEFEVNFDEDKTLNVLADDGVRIFVDGKLETEDWNSHPASYSCAGVLKKGKHQLKIEYFQGTGNAELRLFLFANKKVKNDEIYLPRGEWMDVFTGKTYKGKQVISRPCTLSEIPLFVKKGSVIALAKDSNNTKLQDWNDITLDYYPSLHEKDDGFLYEDDRDTIAYQKGECRITSYHACYDEKTNSFVITLAPSKGEFQGKYYEEEKNIKLKYHSYYSFQVEKVMVNGEEVSFDFLPRDMKAKPFASTDRSLDSDVVIVNFKHHMKEKAVITLQLENR